MSSPVPTTDPLFPSRFLPLAEQICASYYAEFPDHVERFGERGQAFCAHDNAYLIAWFVDDLDGQTGSFVRNVSWLAGVLHGREFPMDAFARNLELVGAAVSETRPADQERIAALVADSRPAIG